MSDIVPRWEWRAFGGDLSRAVKRLAELESTGYEESEEVYLISRRNEANVKIRNGLIDIKRLEQIDSDGLEQWRPVLKMAFPLPAETVVRIFEVLGVTVPALARADYSQGQLVTELVAQEPNLQALSVRKARTRYRIGGCSVELTDVMASGRSVRTLAVESEVPGVVLTAVRELGLSRVPNRSYPKGLRILIGMNEHHKSDRFDQVARIRYAAIDVGTNSVKLHVAERDDAGHWHRVLDRVEITRLGDGLHETGDFQREAEARTITAISSMVEQAKSAGAQHVVAVGTMGLRSARNSAAFLDAVRSACGLAIEVISGDDEGRLAYLAVQEGLGLADGRVVVFDTGGGSTQVTLGRGRQVLERFSLNLGAIRLTEQYSLNGAVSRENLDAALAAIAGELGRLDSVDTPDILVGMGGAVTNMAAVSLGMIDYDPDRIQGASLSHAEVKRQIGTYAGRDAAQRRDIRGLQPGRAEIILAGACIVLTMMEKLRQDRISVSDRALRHGVLIDRFRA